MRNIERGHDWNPIYTDETRFARHMGLIHRGREILRIRKTLQRFAPGALMRGREQDAVDIENGRSQSGRRVRSSLLRKGS
jgi:hypothetical protein